METLKTNKNKRILDDLRRKIQEIERSTNNISNGSGEIKQNKGLCNA